MVKAQLAFDRRDKNQRMCGKDIGAPASSYRNRQAYFWNHKSNIV
jgi:hypothetical protein